MALLQAMLGFPPLVSVTLDTWKVFLQTLQPSDLGLYIGVTSAAFLASWEQFNRDQRAVAKECLEYIVIECGDKLSSHLGEVADLRRYQELQAASTRLSELRNQETPQNQLRRILNRTSNENYAVACQAMEELKSFMLSKHSGFIHDLASGDAFSPLVSEIVSKLMAAAARDDENAEPLRLLAYHCLGIFGAVDPDRFELPSGDEHATLFSNFNDEGDAVAFALYLISNVLVGVFRSASDLNYQTQVAYVIQELLKFCKFTPNILSSAPPSSVTLKVRRRWENLPKHVVETVAPFLESKYHKKDRLEIRDSGVVYLVQPTYREWIQQWTAYLIDKAVGTHVNAIFPLFHWIIVHKDASIAHRLLPHLVLNLMIFGPEEEVELIRLEILTVLQDQVNPDGRSTNDKRFLSTQVRHILETPQPL
jgi:serine/threonine-protein kinase ATR